MTLWFSHLPVLSIHQTHFIKSNVNSEKQVLECTRKIMKINEKFSHIFVACRGWGRLVMNLQGVDQQWKCQTHTMTSRTFFWLWESNWNNKSFPTHLKLKDGSRPKNWSAVPMISTDTSGRATTYVILQCVIKTVKYGDAEDFWWEDTKIKYTRQDEK